MMNTTNFHLSEPTFITINIFGTLFYLIILVIFCIEWKTLTLHGWTVFCYILSQFFSYIFGTFGSFQVAFYKDESLFSNFCIFTGAMTHYFILLTFSWLTIINVDIWWSFRYLRRPLDKNVTKQFVTYVILSFIFSTTIVVTGLVLQHFDNGRIIVPNYGAIKCFLSPKALLPYLYGPAAVLLLLNVVFFTVTCVNLWKYRRETEMATNRKQKESVLLFLKLFAIMGVPMILAKLPNLLNMSWAKGLTNLVYAVQAFALLVLFIVKHFVVVRKVLGKFAFKKLCQ